MKEYIKEAVKSESNDFEKIRKRLHDTENMRLLHAAIGLCTESGEMQDQLKKHIFYGKELDKINLIEEMGDLFWYLAIMADELNVSFEEIQEGNIKKLKKRYEGKFGETKAKNRDLAAERKILEGE